MLLFWGIALFLYWSLPLGALTYQIRWLHRSGPRNDMLEWAELMRRVLGIKMKKVGVKKLVVSTQTSHSFDIFMSFLRLLHFYETNTLT